MANPEDEEHLFEQSNNTSSSNQHQNRPNQIWNNNIEQSTAVDELDAVRSSLRSNLHRNCQLNKQIYDCECCLSDSIQLSSSIAHIDENESDDEYLDAETYTTANSTIDDDLTEHSQLQTTSNLAQLLTNSDLMNSNNNFQNAISSDLFYNLNDQQNCLDTVHTNGQFNEQSDNNYNHELNQTKLSSCKSSSLITKTNSNLATTTTITSSSNNNSSISQRPKCHCRNTYTAKQRPLSLSSISSSSSSCCSLSRNNSLALSDHLKKPYLASIESLGDDELNNGNVNKYQLNSDEHSSGIISDCHSSENNSSTEPSVHSTCSCCVLRSNSNLSLVRSASTNSNQSHCRCSHSDNYEQDYCSNEINKSSSNNLIYRQHHPANQLMNKQSNLHTLSQMDRVIMEIVQTESTYVKDLSEIIEGYFVYLNKKLFEHSELKKTSQKNDYDSDGEDEMTNTNSLFSSAASTNSFNIEVQSSTILKSSSIKQFKRNSKQRNKTANKLTFGNLNNQFNLEETSNQSILINQTSHTLPKTFSKQQMNSFKLKQLNSSLLNQTKQLDSITNIKQEQLSNLFGNLSDIYQFNSLFLNQLVQCDFEPVQIAQCFVDNADGFHVYSQYCTNYPKQVETLAELNRNTYTNQLLKTRQIELGHSLPISAYLLKPVQRILKYHLLLNNMVKHFELEHTNEHNSNDDQIDNRINEQQVSNNSQQECENAERSLRNALSVMQNMATHINTMKKKHEHAVRVQEIQSLLIGWQGEDLTTFGELVAEGTFKLFGNKTSRHLFLFDKMLLVVKKKDDSLFTYKAHILCSNLMLIESIRSEPLCFHAIPFNNPKIQYTFQAKNLDQKREWCLLLKNVILESYNTIPMHAKQIVLGLGQKTSGNLGTENKHKVFPVHLNRKLSAPEYLEKRACKAQQKLSSTNLVNPITPNCNGSNLSLGLQFSSLQKGFKLRKSLKKGVHLIGGRNNNVLNNNLNIKKSIEFKEITINESTATDLPMHNNEEIQTEQQQRELIIKSYEDNNHQNRFDKEMESDSDKLAIVNNISNCLSSTSLTTTNDSYTDSGVGSTSSVCCYSQLRLTTPISLGSSIASIESNATTTTANSHYSTGYSQSSGSTNSKLTGHLLQCSSIEQCSSIINQSSINGNQGSTDDFNEINVHESTIKSNPLKTFKNKRCTNRCCSDPRYGFNNRLFDASPSASLTGFDSNKVNYLHHSSKFYNAAYRHSKYLNLNPEEIELRPHNRQVRRVQSFTIGNKNINSRLLTNYSSSSNKSFALNSCTGTNSSAILQHTVSFRKSPNVDLVLAKLRHLHRRPAIVAAQKQKYKQQKMQQLNELKLQDLNLNNNQDQMEQNDNVMNDDNSNNQTNNSIFRNDCLEDSSSSEDENDEIKKNAIQKLIKPNKLSKTKDSNSMEFHGSMEELSPKQSSIRTFDLDSPTLPQIWLKKHEKNFHSKDAPTLKRIGSLPRNFEACL